MAIHGRQLQHWNQVADAGGKGYRISLEPNWYVVMQAKDWNNFTEVVTIKTNNIPYALYGTTLVC